MSNTNEFTEGPFSYEPTRSLKVNDQRGITWAIKYDGSFLGESFAPESATRKEISEILVSHRIAWTTKKRRHNYPDLIRLIDQATGKTQASFYSWAVPDLTGGLIDDRFQYWLVSANGLRSRNVSLAEYGEIVRQFSAPEHAWVCGLLGDDLLTSDHDDWRAPTSFELRHVVGKGSFTGVTGAQAAMLVGVAPQNFRKYTASDDSSSRQKMSFAMWHLLLHKLKIQTLEP